MFFDLGSKNNGIIVFFGQRLAKTLLFTQLSAGCNKYVFHAKEAPKQSKLHCFGLWQTPKQNKHPPKKCPKWTFQTLLFLVESIFGRKCSVFSHIKKRQNTTRGKDFRVGCSKGAYLKRVC